MHFLFEYIPGTELKKTLANADCPTTKEEIDKKFLSREYMMIEYESIKALYEFQFLNLYNLNRYLNLVLPEDFEFRKVSYQKNIELLYNQGVLDCYRNEDGLKAYCLSESAYRYFSEQKQTYRKAYFYRQQDSLTTQDILKKLSVNQYHISVLEWNKGSIHEAYANLRAGYRDVGRTTIPSLIKINTVHPITRKNHKVTLIGMPLNKEGESVAVFINKLLTITGFLSENKERYPNPIFITTTDTTKEATDAFNLIRPFKEFDNYSFTYVTDLNTQRDNPLEWLNYCEYEDDGKVSIHALEIKSRVLIKHSQP